MKPKEAQEAFDKMCEDFEQKKNKMSVGIFMRDYPVPEGMTYEEVFYQYISLMKQENGFDYFFAYPEDEDGTRIFGSLMTEQFKELPAETFEFEDEDDQ